MRLYGRKPHTPDDRDLLLGEHLAHAGVDVTEPIHEPFGHGNTYPLGGWFMNGNGPWEQGEEVLPHNWKAAQEGAGDCVNAAEINEEKVALTDAGVPPDEAHRIVGDAVASLSLYSAITGYDPKSGNNDNGTEVRDRLKYMQKTGRPRNDGKVFKLGPYAKVDPTNLPLLLFALKYFEAVPLGLAVTDHNEAAYEKAVSKGETPIWSASGEVVGLHCMAAVGRPDPKHIAALTWCWSVHLTESYREQRVEEAWCYLSADRYSKVTGKTYEGKAADAMQEYLKAIKAS